MAKVETVSKTDLVNEISEATGIPRRDVHAVVDSFWDKVQQHVINEDKNITFVGIGKFYKKELSSRTYVVPGRGKVKSPDAARLSFKASQRYQA